MNEKTFSLLEFHKLREEIAAFCVSEEGRAELLRRVPSASKSEVRRLKSLAADWAREAASDNPPPLASWQAVSEIFHLLKTEGARLSAEEFARLGGFCHVSEALRLWGKGRENGKGGKEGAFSHDADSDKGDSASVREKAAALPDLSQAHSLIFSVIEPDGTLRDLPQLALIRSCIAEIRRDIEKRLSRLCSDPATMPALQSFLPALRGGRQVLAVKANFRGRVRGIVHEVSQSGQTIYVEPAEIVERGNDLVTEEIRLEREIASIFCDLASKLREFSSLFKAALKELIFFDGLSAASRWGKEKACVFALDLPQQADSRLPSPERGGGFRLNLIKARHPFLREKAVPIDISIPESSSVLIITGPNAGGKTVALKTAGLFALINQCGWPVPAGEGTALPVFDYIGCDIGDDQSVEDSLSTFSARMQNAGEMLKAAGAGSLILLDEFGSGTDPEEGAAIAMAILDALVEKGALVLATTHHAAIKHYGFARPGCINASVEFNAETLEPSYKIIMGMPGESRAIDIAARNGIPQKIAAAARAYLSGGGADVSELIQKLAEKYEQARALEKELQKREADLREASREADLRSLRLRQKELLLREGEFGRMKSFFLESRKQLENLVREIREGGGAVSRETTAAVKRWTENFESALESEKKEIETVAETALGGGAFSGGKTGEEASGALAPAAIAPGMEVFVAPSGVRGRVLRRGKRKSWIVETGSLKVAVSENRLTCAASEPEKSGQGAPSVEFHSAGASGQPAFELKLLGMRRADAEQALVRQIDLCVMTGLHEFSVIHGKGDGVLQEAAAAVLKGNPAVAEFHFALPENGGTGKTIVRLAPPDGRRADEDAKGRV